MDGRLVGRKDEGMGVIGDRCLVDHHLTLLYALPHPHHKHFIITVIPDNKIIMMY